MGKHIRTWEQLYKRLGKQTIFQLRNNRIIVKVGDNYYNARLVYTHNGSCFHLEVTDWSEQNAESNSNNQ